MRALSRKLFREMLQMKGQVIAICLVMACGVATVVMSMTTLSSLLGLRERYYAEYGFAHVFLGVKRAPTSLAARIGEVPGVERIETRVVMEVTLDVPGMVEPGVARLVSLPERGQASLNRLYLRSGRLPESGRREVVTSEPFALAHGLAPGDSVAALINGRREEVRIVGIALSPEYVYQIRAGDLVPDDRRFGVFWMDYKELATAFDMYGAFNDASLSLMPGASEEEVIARVDRITERYGGTGAYGRDDQMSHRYVSDEMQQLRAMTLIPPSIFLTVAAFLLNVVVSRLVLAQREHIAILKAFGYTGAQVAGHYLRFVMIIVGGAVVVGGGAGGWLGSQLTDMYSEFFRFPHMEYHFDPRAVAIALAVTALAGTVGSLAAMRRAWLLPPAEAMRPEPPMSYRATLVERLGLQRLMSQPARMILRHLERRPMRSALSALGISLATSLLILGNFTRDAIDWLIERQFHVVQRQDAQITYPEPSSARTIHAAARLPGVMHAEPFRQVPARMRSGSRDRLVAILGLDRGAGLRRVIDARARSVELPPEGLVLSDKLAEVLGVAAGDTVRIEVLEGARPVREAPVAAVIEEYFGTSVYADRRWLNRLMREGNVSSGAFLQIDAAREDDLYRAVKETPRVLNMNITLAAIRGFEETLAENLLRMRLFNLAFATIIAFGVVYNSARISLAERSHELATLRVLGLTRGEISFILLGELAVLAVVGIPFGLVLGYQFAAIAVTALQTETHRIPLIVEPRTFAFAATVIVVATLLSGMVVRRRLDRLDLVAVLKTRQ